MIEEAKELAPSLMAREKKVIDNGTQQQSTEERDPNLFGRRWIWVHHIKDKDRRKSIRKEAQDLNLGGFLKSGYPGIIVVEGKSAACDEFVTWVKGNKSRPGGFGRNWGHHVKGELNFSVEACCLPREFAELEELADLAGICKDRGLENEFLEYVMQHKGSA